MNRFLLPVIIAAFLFSACGGSKSSNQDTAQAPAADTAAQAPQEPGDRGYRVAVGDTAPVFTLDIEGGSTFSLAEQQGKIVMLQFTASWCGICRREMPFIEKDIWQRFKSNPDFCLMAIDREETPDKVAMMREKTGITYPIAYDTDGAVFRLYAYPDAGVTRNVLIDRNGVIRMLTRRFEQQEFDSLCTEIARLLEGEEGR